MMNQQGVVKAAVLVVDDHDVNRRRLAKYLSRRFSEVFGAHDLEEAERILERHSIGLLVCSFEPKPDSPRSLRFIGGWRSIYPSIRAAVVFLRGDPGVVKQPPGVDAVIGWEQPLEDLMRALLSPYRQGADR